MEVIMFIDYVTLMLINMVAGLVTLAWFLWSDLDKPQNGRWAPAFAVPGVVAVICGLAMSFTWPLPGPYNIAFGESSVLLGFLFLAAAWCLAKEWDLRPLGIYAFFAGWVGVLIGIRIIDLGLTQKPGLAGAGFILTGLGGVLAGVILTYRNIILRRIGSVVLTLAALIWAMTGYLGYWFHLVPPVK
jgi:putative membrane protein